MEVPVKTFEEAYMCRSLVKPHFGLGPAGAHAFAEGLRLNTTLTRLDLRDNQLGQDGCLALAGALASNASITELNLSNNKVCSHACVCAISNMTAQGTSLTHSGPTHYAQAGAAGYALFRALENNTVVRVLTLSSNNISDFSAKALQRCMAANTTITHMDLSYNKIGDSGAKALAEGLAMRNCTLKNLHLRWNKINKVGGTSLAQSLRDHNTSLLLLDVGWNNIGHSAGYEFAEMLTRNTRLRRLDLSQNRLPLTSALMIADALRFNSGLVDLQLSYNPIGRQGAAAVIAAVNVNQSISSWGLTAIEANFQPMHTGSPFDPLNPDGHHRLQLNEAWDRAVAVMLHARVAAGLAMWRRVSLGRKPLDDAVWSNPQWVVPNAGRLDLDHVTLTEVKDKNKKPIVHFVLDLSKPDDHRMACTLAERGLNEPGENWLRETLDGEPFDFEESQAGVEWVRNQKVGILELDYLSTGIAHEVRHSET